jgi:hypothetical protein
VRTPTDEEVDKALDSIIDQERRRRAQKEYAVVKNNKPKKKPQQKKAEGETKRERGPIHILVDQLGNRPGQYRTSAQVAEELGIAASTVRRIARREDAPGPSYYTKMGSTTVALYTRDDIKRIAKYLEDQHRLIPAEQVEK